MELVTVTFRGEDAFQRLQAQSVARFAQPGTFSRITVIDNGEPSLSETRRRRLRGAYGPHSEIVDIVDADEIAAVPSTSGWLSQQVLKLKVAERVNAPWYVLLDSKNHIIRPVTRATFLGADGKAHGATHSYETHPLRPRLLTTLNYFGLPESHVSQYPRTATPFVMHTHTARDLMSQVAQDASFEEAFVAADLSEFFAYSAWILASGRSWDDLYTGEPLQAPVVWGKSARGQDATEDAQRLSAPFFAIHRSSLFRADRRTIDDVCALWVSCGLVDNMNRARAVIRHARTDLLREKARARLRSIARRGEGSGAPGGAL
ncbi:DUF6492 family protein [Microbacterium sp. MC2]